MANIPADLPKPVFQTAPLPFVPQYLNDTRIDLIGDNPGGSIQFTTLQRQISGFPSGVDKFIAVDINACVQVPNAAPPPTFLTSIGYGLDWQIVQCQLQFLKQSKPLITLNVFVEGNDQASAGGNPQYMFGGLTYASPSLVTGAGSVPQATSGLVFRSFGPSAINFSGASLSAFPALSDYDVLFQYFSAYDAAVPNASSGVLYPSVRQARRFTFDADTVNFTCLVATEPGFNPGIPIGIGLAGMIL